MIVSIIIFSLLRWVKCRQATLSHWFLTSALWRQPVSFFFFVMFLCCCFCVVGNTRRKNTAALPLRRLYRFFIMRECCEDSWPELWMIDTLTTPQLMRQKFSQQNSIKINISNILRWTKLHSVQPKHSLLAREVANSSSSLPELFFSLHIFILAECDAS